MSRETPTLFVLCGGRGLKKGEVQYDLIPASSHPRGMWQMVPDGSQSHCSPGVHSRTVSSEGRSD